MEQLKIKLDSLLKNTRTDVNDIIDSRLNVDSSDYLINSILSVITNSQKIMSELLEINCGMRMLASDTEEDIDIICFNM